MSIDYQQLRLDGIYQMNQQNDLMLRVKIPAGVLSSEQAEKISEIGERFGKGMLHLTSRASIEFHWLRYEQLEQIMPMLAAVGLTSRGACGGAVRGISCSTSFGPGFEKIQALARGLQRHFAGNPYFEGLPKKFKLAVEAGYAGARHLIQDLALVYSGDRDGAPRFDVWCAGGLGREPQPAFCYARNLEEQTLLPLIEAVIAVYAEGAPAGKRLKHLVNEIGEADFRKQVEKRHQSTPPPRLRPSVAGPLVVTPEALITLPIFAGELRSEQLRNLAQLAKLYCGGFLALNTDQDILLPLADPDQSSVLQEALTQLGLIDGEPLLSCRLCPGNHECRMGLVATRDLARELNERLAGGPLANAGFAISGCPNSCSQPQLADYGIVTRKLVKAEDGRRTPRFDLLKRSGVTFGEPLATELSRESLFLALNDLNR